MFDGGAEINTSSRPSSLSLHFRIILNIILQRGLKMCWVMEQRPSIYFFFCCKDIIQGLQATDLSLFPSFFFVLLCVGEAVSAPGGVRDGVARVARQGSINNLVRKTLL